MKCEAIPDTGGVMSWKRGESGIDRGVYEASTVNIEARIRTTIDRNGWSAWVVKIEPLRFIRHGRHTGAPDHCDAWDAIGPILLIGMTVVE